MRVLLVPTSSPGSKGFITVAYHCSPHPSPSSLAAKSPHKILRSFPGSRPSHCCLFAAFGKGFGRLREDRGVGPSAGAILCRGEIPGCAEAQQVHHMMLNCNGFLEQYITRGGTNKPTNHQSTEQQPCDLKNNMSFRSCWAELAMWLNTSRSCTRRPATGSLGVQSAVLLCELREKKGAQQQDRSEL